MVDQSHEQCTERGGLVLDSVLKVHFEGDATGVEELSWGQHELWHAMKQKPTWLPIGNVRPLRTGTTVEDAVADLRFVMSSYPTMRTRLRFDPDGPKQVVSGSGVTSLEVIDAADDADPAEVADEVWKRYSEKDYDFVTDWPLRMAVVRHRGVLTHRVWVMCHLVTDGSGSTVIAEELASRDTSGSVAALSALEQARWQRSPAGQRQCESAMRHWEKILRSVPTRRFAERSGAGSPRYWEARFDSPAAFLAARAITARTGVESSSVLLACYALGLARVCGINPVVVVLVVNNRFRPGLTRTVSPLIQPGLFVLNIPDTPHLTVDEVVTRTRSRAMSAYKYAYYDPYRREELLERVDRERGEHVDLECAFNDRRLTMRDERGPAPAPERIRAAVPDSTFRWMNGQDERPCEGLYIYVDDVPDKLQLTIATDLHHVSPEEVEACVRGMEEVAVAAALDPTARAHAPAGGR